MVDDYPDAAELLCTLLTVLGHDARPAHTGAEALALADELEPDLALVDIDLPDMSGLEVARRLRDKRTTYLVAVSGSPLARARAWEVGFAQFILKPIDTARLRQIIATVEQR